MANNYEARESSTKPTIWAQSESGTARFYVGPDRSSTNKRAQLEQKTSHDGLARHGLFTSKLVKTAFLH